MVFCTVRDSDLTLHDVPDPDAEVWPWLIDQCFGTADYQEHGGAGAKGFCAHEFIPKCTVSVTLLSHTLHPP